MADRDAIQAIMRHRVQIGSARSYLFRAFGTFIIRYGIQNQGSRARHPVGFGVVQLLGQGGHYGRIDHIIIVRDLRRAAVRSERGGSYHVPAIRRVILGLSLEDIVTGQFDMGAASGDGPGVQRRDSVILIHDAVLLDLPDFAVIVGRRVVALVFIHRQRLGNHLHCLRIIGNKSRHPLAEIIKILAAHEPGITRHLQRIAYPHDIDGRGVVRDIVDVNRFDSAGLVFRGARIVNIGLIFVNAHGLAVFSAVVIIHGVKGPVIVPVIIGSGLKRKGDGRIATQGHDLSSAGNFCGHRQCRIGNPGIGHAVAFDIFGFIAQHAVAVFDIAVNIHSHPGISVKNIAGIDPAAQFVVEIYGDDFVVTGSFLTAARHFHD